MDACSFICLLSYQILGDKYDNGVDKDSCHNIFQFSSLTEASHHVCLAQASQSAVALAGTQTHAVSP
jgi:hypothetical protein